MMPCLMALLKELSLSNNHKYLAIKKIQVIAKILKEHLTVLVIKGNLPLKPKKMYCFQ